MWFFQEGGNRTILTVTQCEYSVPSIFLCFVVPYNNRCTLLLENISLFHTTAGVLTGSFISYFIVCLVA
jgi:hypothetical protein